MNKEFNVKATPEDFYVLCLCSYLIILLQEKIYIAEEVYHANNIFMFTRLCGVVEDKYHLDRIKIIQGVTKGRILDFGGGLGDMSNALANKGLDVEYYDINRFCKKFVKENYPKVKVVDKPTGTYDTILCFDTIPYIKNIEGFAKQISELLNPQGYFIMEDIEENEPNGDKMKLLSSLIKIQVINVKKEPK